MIAHGRQRQACERHTVDRHAERTHGREHRISAWLRAQRLHDGLQDLGGQEGVFGVFFVRQLEDERDVNGRAHHERLGQRPEVNETRVAERHRVSPREAPAHVDQHRVARGDPLDRSIDVGLRVLNAADDDDVKPEAREAAPQPGERLATEAGVAGARVGWCDDECQPHDSWAEFLIANGLATRSECPRRSL